MNQGQLLVQVADKAMQWSPYTYDAKLVKRSDPNKKRRWLIPLVLVAQIAFKVELDFVHSMLPALRLCLPRHVS